MLRAQDPAYGQEAARHPRRQPREEEGQVVRSGGVKSYRVGIDPGARPGRDGLEGEGP